MNDAAHPTTPRQDATSIWHAGLDAVRARPLVTRSIRFDGDALCIEDVRIERTQFDRLIVVGAGKAATAMATGLLDAVQDVVPVSGWINVPDGTQSDLPGITVHVGRPAGVNEPTEDAVIGANRILEIVAQAGPRDLCIALISGGGSALLPAPSAGITLDDKVAVTRWLSGAGADIKELNTVRKHLSRIKGGGLLSACRAGRLVTLVLSDVLGDPLDLIASGPTVMDPSSGADAIEVLRKYDPQQTLPPSVYRCLQHPRKSDTTGNMPHDIVVLGNNPLAIDEAGIRAESLGYNHVMQSARESEGLAEDVGRHLARMTTDMLRRGDSAHPVNCLISGGEPTVRLAPPERRGKGGRNQQLVLAAYEELLKHDLTPQQWEQVCILSGGTDGEDGPTDAAGALIDAQVHRRAREAGLNVQDHLQRNDAYTFFLHCGGLLITGPTGTNVCDVRVAVIKNSSCF
ncbi:glycerate kinase type-2 family protein [Crateriforma conspicua]|uniref:Putative hydroxypyruvate reductase n=1 Tax=Crateriforma conspicua TaxID=2527996 RepID=A0A5C5Y7Q7_9PLAN|nr:DUF4147 domain-containing protein [Crateriforma conspicua]QDV65814.1 Putative hydroxypyruvate reductase [Crateriforma conspicua]TWT71214.1 putative hydroxypyruvate reductase [Crateriforma conspicua]